MSASYLLMCRRRHFLDLLIDEGKFWWCGFWGSWILLFSFSPVDTLFWCWLWGFWNLLFSFPRLHLLLVWALRLLNPASFLGEGTARARPGFCAGESQDLKSEEKKFCRFINIAIIKIHPRVYDIEMIHRSAKMQNLNRVLKFLNFEIQFLFFFWTVEISWLEFFRKY